MNATEAMIVTLLVVPAVLDRSDVGLAVGVRVAPAVDQLVIIAVALVAVGVIDFGTRLVQVVHSTYGEVIAVICEVIAVICEVIAAICDMALTCVASKVVMTTLVC